VFVLIMVVLGGMGNVWGVLIGAVVLAWINNTGMQEFGNTLNGWLGTHIEIPNYTFLIFGILLVLMMLFRREGLLPERRTQQILREPARTELESMGSDVEAGQADNTASEFSEVGAAAAGRHHHPHSHDNDDAGTQR
jgi:branched-chain amino acid transport system permease protein